MLWFVLVVVMVACMYVAFRIGREYNAISMTVEFGAVAFEFCGMYGRVAAMLFVMTTVLSYVEDKVKGNIPNAPMHTVDGLLTAIRS